MSKEEEENTKKELPSRSSRARLGALLEQEDPGADDEFWNQPYFQEEANDAFFEVEEEEEDVVDADFDEPEGPEFDPDPEQQDEKDPDAKKRKLNVYVDPKGAKAKKAEKLKAAREKKKQVKTEEEAYHTDDNDGEMEDDNMMETEEKEEVIPMGGKKRSSIGDTDRQVRASTSMATKEGNEYRKQTIKDQQKKKKKQTRTRQVKKMTQEQMLEEAKVTEQYNTESLAILQAIEEEKKARAIVKTDNKIPIITFHSKGGLDTIHFSDPSIYPSIFTQNPPAQPTRGVCAITGLPARFIEPKTNTPYANLQAYRIIKERYLKTEEEKYDKKLSQLTALLEEKKKQKEINMKKMGEKIAT
ncbi:hypothetical protein PROFUN_12662 [Planoprotostelium fungivorum]|uniref:Vps72/YL1 C-terminal domain-containing protein n=1 Tax=Planoprotostelium fungivorum TaxID=1890364 RepID=A0A2P6N706_9EUKA|nr:hypothetical protein PROFUN_12662 [Planoprotostelium fungivorum]